MTGHEYLVSAGDGKFDRAECGHGQNMAKIMRVYGWIPQTPVLVHYSLR